MLSDGMARLSVRELAAGHGGRALIRGLCFELEPGERIALTGPSGSGKTTTLRALALLDDPIEGALSLEGRSPVEHGVPTWRRRVMLSTQRAVLFGERVSDDLARPFTYRGAPRPLDVDEARGLLARLGIEAKWDEPSDKLSEGERQRVALVRALLLRPDVLLLDEPTSALDPASAEVVEALLLERCADGLALVLVSHDAAQRARLDARALDLHALRVDR